MSNMFNKDFYAYIPTYMRDKLDTKILLYRNEPWFENAWNAFAKMASTRPMRDIVDPDSFFEKIELAFTPSNDEEYEAIDNSDSVEFGVTLDDVYFGDEELIDEPESVNLDIPEDSELGQAEMISVIKEAFTDIWQKLVNLLYVFGFRKYKNATDILMHLRKIKWTELCFEDFKYYSDILTTLENRWELMFIDRSFNLIDEKTFQKNQKELLNDVLHYEQEIIGKLKIEAI